MANYNYTILRVWGIPIRINVSLLVFLPILAWLIGSGEQIAVYSALITDLTPAAVEPGSLSGPSDRWLVGIATAVSLFASVTFHELGHAWAAMRYDIEVESITLWLLGGLASLRQMPDQWLQEFWIAIAGPASSILLAAGCAGALFVIPGSATLAVYLVGFLAIMNIVLAVFNMLPAFPMDGGRVLRALLARNRSYVSATRIAARIGVVFAFGFAIVGVLVFSPILLLLAFFIYLAATNESRSVVITELLSGQTVADLIGNQKPIPADMPVGGAFERLFAARRTNLPVVDDNGEIVGVLTAAALQDVSPEEFRTTTVGEIATTDLPHLDGAATAAEGLYDLLGSRGEVAIVEWEGRRVGLISRSDFTAALDIRRETGPF